MYRPIRIILAVAIVVGVAACSATAAPESDDPTPSAPAEPSLTPSASPSPTPPESPSPAPEASPEPIGVLTVQDGAAVDGPGVSLAEALVGDLSQPLLVRGTLFRTDDGQVFFTDSVTDASVPTFGDIRLTVDNYPTDGPTWDMADADIKGLQESNGVRYFEDTKLYAVIFTGQ